MTENQYETALLALGAKDVTSYTQRKNGTTAFKLPTGQVVSEHKTGYIRRNLYAEESNSGGRTGFGGKCYQLNPTYNIPHQSIGQDGKLYKYVGSKARTLIWSRKTRLKKLFLYTIKKLNNEL